MRGPKPPTVELTDLERQEIERLLKRHLTPQQLVLRARIVLAAADGANNRQIARRLGVSLDMVRRWRERWIALGAASLEELAVEERLTDAPRPGKPRTITAEQECRIIALGCESPQGIRDDRLASGPGVRSPMSSHAEA
jgi:putative transposase